MTIAIKVGRRIAALRKRAGMTQRQLAEMLGTAPEVLSRIEHGTNAPSLERLEEIATALRVPPRELLDFGEPVDWSSNTRLAAALGRLSPEDLRLITGMAELIAREHGTK